MLGTMNSIEQKKVTRCSVPKKQNNGKLITGLSRDFFIRRLEEIFAKVARNPGVLKNSRNCPFTFSALPRGI
jgi:hypothetical protein